MYHEADDAIAKELAAQTAKIVAEEKAVQEKEKASDRAVSVKQVQSATISHLVQK